MILKGQMSMTQYRPVKGRSKGHAIFGHQISELFKCKTRRFFVKTKKKLYFFKYSSGGGRWIRTTEGIASRFTVCPLWPLGNSPILNCAPVGGAGGRTRTPDLLITNQLLYRLSYTSTRRGQPQLAYNNRGQAVCQ